MTEDLKGARANLNKSRKELVGAYYSIIQKACERISERNFPLITQGLANIVDEIIPTGALFDKEIAKRLRENLKLSQAKLAKQIEMRPADISNFESGKDFPKPNSRLTKYQKYLSWLKENGYNPYKGL